MPCVSRTGKHFPLGPHACAGTPCTMPDRTCYCVLCGAWGPSLSRHKHRQFIRPTWWPWKVFQHFYVSLFLFPVLMLHWFGSALLSFLPIFPSLVPCLGHCHMLATRRMPHCARLALPLHPCPQLLCSYGGDCSFPRETSSLLASKGRWTAQSISLACPRARRVQSPLHFNTPSSSDAAGTNACHSQSWQWPKNATFKLLMHYCL